MSRTAAIILAAGASTRLGQPKQLVLLAGEPLLERAVRIAIEASCDPVVVVLGAEAASVLVHCPLANARVVMNEAWPEGMASSIRAGIAAIMDQADAAILMTCDQPAVYPDHLRRLAKTGVNVTTASVYAGLRGVPACFPAHCFPDLLLLSGDQGARGLMESATTIELPGGELDIDTSQNLADGKVIYDLAT